MSCEVMKGYRSPTPVYPISDRMDILKPDTAQPTGKEHGLWDQSIWGQIFGKLINCCALVSSCVKMGTKVILSS